MVFVEAEGMQGLVWLVVLDLPCLFILYACVNIFIFILFFFRLSCSSFITLTLM